MKSGLVTGLLAFLLAVGMASVATAGPGLGDTDGDTVDDFFDNCQVVPNHNSSTLNGGQLDSDGDGCGNICDGDFDQTSAVDVADFGLFKAGFAAGGPGVTDMDGSGATDIADFGLFKGQFAQGFPGPSVAAHRDTTVCP